jgi:hypothetical protein
MGGNTYRKPGARVTHYESLKQLEPGSQYLVVDRTGEAPLYRIPGALAIEIAQATALFKATQSKLQTWLSASEQHRA